MGSSLVVEIFFDCWAIVITVATYLKASVAGAGYLFRPLFLLFDWILRLPRELFRGLRSL